jgi:hypothetical protein
MGSNPRAHLAYGYDLGSYEDFKAAERGEWGSPNLPWLDEESGTYAFSGGAEDILKAAGMTAVEIAFSGAEESIGWMLIAKDSERSVEWDLAMTLDLIDMVAQPNRGLWDTKLAAALTALGLTPTQDGPKWLVYPSYG